jgi:DNA repair protein RecO (recombination protein O)
MHHIYRTEAIILSSRPSGDSGKYLTALSKDYGVLKIDAQAVRKTDSKLRQSIQDYSVVDISFVRGKTGNKLVNASFVSSFFYDIKNIKVLKSLTRIFRLIEKMIVDEEKDETVYDLLIETEKILQLDNKDSDEFLKALEVVVVYKILSRLGYISEEGEYEFIISQNISDDLISKVEQFPQKDRENLIRLINQAINESHL